MQIRNNELVTLSASSLTSTPAFTRTLAVSSDSDLDSELGIGAPIIDSLHCDELDQQRLTLNVLRLDQIHPTLGGNKWFKLKHNIANIRQQGATRILSFGGAYSNHIRALAALGKLLNIETIGIIRGELSKPLNPVLAFARQQGMTLLGIERSLYRKKEEAEFLKGLKRHFGAFHLLPEGGSNALAVGGCVELAKHLQGLPLRMPDFVMLPCGTGATMAGLIRGIGDLEGDKPQVLGVSVLKGRGYLEDRVRSWLPARTHAVIPQWQVLEDFHCGGYARLSPQLASFLQWFETISDLPLEPVYTGKLFYALFQLVAAGYFPRGAEILLIHTGGVHRCSGGASSPAA
ncbi:MAG: pyridoxal-phosphate dependent enzyme [Proteobacteria bacterium]|nr:pyridoxal-phosphate dependent enzyme [Pseudomonadota bacterium]